MSYYEKYLKYKNKYVTLKKQIGGICYLLSKCDKLAKGCKAGDFDYTTSKDIDDTNKISQKNINLGKEILACKPTLKQLLDAGYTIKDINKFVLVPFTIPDIVEYNITSKNEGKKQLVFNDLNEIFNFGTYSNDRMGFGTCYDKFDYSNLTPTSTKKIIEIITLYTSPSDIKPEIYLDMIKYLTIKLLENTHYFQKDNSGNNLIIENKIKKKNELPSIGIKKLHDELLKVPQISNLIKTLNE